MLSEGQAVKGFFFIFHSHCLRCFDIAGFDDDDDDEDGSEASH